jgi:hypothetical protein
MAELDQDALATLDRLAEIDVRTPRRDGSVASRPIWVVVVDGEPYVRSYHGERGAWYRRSLADGHAEFVVGDRVLDLAVEPARGDELDERVSAAFRAKYGARSPGPTEAMLVPEVVVTQLRLRGRGG